MISQSGEDGRDAGLHILLAVSVLIPFWSLQSGNSLCAWITASASSYSNRDEAFLKSWKRELEKKRKWSLVRRDLEKYEAQPCVHFQEITSRRGRKICSITAQSYTSKNLNEEIFQKARLGHVMKYWEEKGCLCQRLRSFKYG